NEFLATIDNGAVPQNAPAVRDGMNTMATIDDDRRVFWQSGDVISINGEAYSAETTGNPVKFIGEGDAGSAPYHAFYPASIAGTGNAGSLPTEQTYTANNNVSNLPMYAMGGGDRVLTFHNICSVLKITVPGYAAGADRIVVSSDQQMNGEFTVQNTDDDKLVAVMSGIPEDAADPDGYRKVTMKTENEEENFGENDVVYIAVPAQAYTNLRVEFLDGTTSLWNKTIDKCTLNVNQIHNINMTRKELCFTAVDANVTVSILNLPTLLDASYNPVTIQYSTDDGSTWPNYEYSTTITLNNIGDKVYFRASKNHQGQFYYQYNKAFFAFSGKVKASGNIMSLYGPDCPDDITLPSLAFGYMFYNAANLVTAPELPATNLGDYCYSNMFNGCTGLISGPKVLPAKTLTESCYYNMFNGCRNLTTAPKILAETLAASSCNAMFSNCNSLQEVYIYAKAGFNEPSCLYNWLYKTASGGTIHCASGTGYQYTGDRSYTNWTVIDDLSNP
ncbi:MAG: hypothetical protein MJ002_06345, partial [Paludibacteraceae bacterium]|nr:hypothetical protein [Paludibacteraceae bacterium]